MKKIFLYFMIALSAMTFASCGSKVDKAELDKKVASATAETQFSDEEYAFMAEYLTEHETQMLNSSDIAPETNYYGALFFANMEGKLKGKAKEQFDAITKKTKSMVEEAQEEAMRAVQEAMQEDDE